MVVVVETFLGVSVHQTDRPKAEQRQKPFLVSLPRAAAAAAAVAMEKNAASAAAAAALISPIHLS